MNRDMHINTLNQFFDKIYVLTMQRAVERHNQLQQDLSGLNYDFFYGIDKKNLNKENLISNNFYSEEEAIKNNRYNKPMKLGEIACSLGHKMIYEDVLKNNYTKVLVLEDDVFFNHKGFNIITSIIEQAKKVNWDILYFDYNKNESKKWFHPIKQILYHIQFKIGLLKWNHTVINNLFAKKYSTNLKFAGYHDYTSAYAINKVAAKILLEIHSPISFPSDHALAHCITNNYLKGFIVVPKVFIQKSQNNAKTYGSYVED